MANTQSDRQKMTVKALIYLHFDTTEERTTAYNSTYKKLAAQWLNEVQFFNQTYLKLESFVLRNRQLLIAAKRYVQP